MNTDLMQKVCDHYENQLWNTADGASARQYMLDRGFTEDTLREFGLGYAPVEWNFECEPEEMDFLAEIEHVYVSSKVVDAFGSRIMFPIKDEQGRVRGFSGRLVGTDDGVKYKNSTESVIFKKSDSIFGISLAREAIFKVNKVIICEGFTDAMAFHQTGTKCAVAAMGVRFTERQLLTLARYTNRLYLSFDADKGGQGATARTEEKARKLGLSLGRISIPEGKDPADILLKVPTT
jgi:DNA primase